MKAVLEVDGLTQRIRETQIVRGASLSLAAGESMAILGPSGSGKTTLLHMLGLLDRPSAGRVMLGGIDAWAEGPSERARLRLESIGFVFQQNSLLPHFTARENVALPAWRRHRDRAAAMRDADAILEGLGVGARGHVEAALLSGGEAQRVAIARALINRPALLLADEPTGSLDSESATSVLDALTSPRIAHAALLVVTHDPAVAARMKRTMRMLDGRLGPAVH